MSELPLMSRAEVAKHNTPESAYIIIDDEVFNVTKFAGMHPGGEQLLLEYAGRDATQEFESMHRMDVLKKYRKRLVVAKVEGAERRTPSDWGAISKVPWAESSYWQGFHSPYFKPWHLEFRAQVRTFLAEHVREAAEEHEASGEYTSAELQSVIGEAGLIACMLGKGEHLKLVPRLPGGITPEQFDTFAELIVRDEVTRLHCPSVEDGFVAGLLISLPAILEFGNDEEHKNLMAKELLTGKKRSCLAITEPWGGSDVAGLRTTAVKTSCGQYYIVNGTKKWITNGMFADYIVTAVRTGGPGAGGVSLLVIDRSFNGGEGIETKRITTTYGFSSGTAYITFEDVKVPVGNLLGRENKGFQCIMGSFNKERWGIAVGVTCKSRFVVEECFKWANQRKVFGKPLISQPVIREKLAHMVRKVEAANAWLENVTFQMDNMTFAQQSLTLGATIALLKLHTTRVAKDIATDAVQIFGGRGVTATGMGKYVQRFVLTHQMPSVYGGAEDIMADLAIRMGSKAFPKGARL